MDNTDRLLGGRGFPAHRVGLMPNGRNGAEARWDGHTYFAYGSNMDAEQMAVRCPGAKLIGRGILKGYSFELDSAGFGTIIRSADSSVEGLLWRVTDDDIDSLDIYEGVGSGCYRSAFAMIRETPKGLISAMVYISNRGRSSGPAPSGYMERIVAAAKEHGFSDPYIDELSMWLGDNERLSEHFGRSEFSCGCVCGDGTLSAANARVHPELIKKLERMRKYMHDKPLHIMPGCRCREFNPSLPDSDNSRRRNCPHCCGLAADISRKGHDIRDLTFMAKNADFCGIEIHDNYVHVDICRDRITYMSDLERRWEVELRRDKMINTAGTDVSD